MASESAHFKQQKAANLNSLVNGKADWQVDPMMQKAKEDAFARVEHDLNSGILQQLRLKREQGLASIIAESCYNAGLTFPQAEKCEAFVKDKDFKLKMLASFAQDHLMKHRMAYEAECHASPEFNRLPTIEEKDRHYAYCHTHFLRRLKQDVSQELEVKAREVFL